MKLLLLSTALAAFALPALADTNCELVDHGGYSSFVRGCDTDGSTGNRPEKVKAPVAPADPDPTPVDPEPVDPGEPTDPVDPPADPDPQPEPEPETPTEPSLPDPEVGGGPEPEAPGDGH